MVHNLSEKMFKAECMFDAEWNTWQLLQVKLALLTDTFD